MKKIIICLAFSMLSWHSFAQDKDIPAQIVKSELFKDEYKNSSIGWIQGSSATVLVFND